MGRLSPSLIKSLQTTDDCTPKSAATHAVSIRTDSGFSKLAFSSLFSKFSSGTSRFLVEKSRLPAPATWVTDSPWDEPTTSTTTTLSPALTDKFFFLFKLKHVAIRLSNYYMVYLHTLYFTLIFPIFMNLTASKDISITFQGYVEEWNSNFPHFNFSIPCLVYLLISFTSHLLSLDFIILPFTADTAKKFRLKRKLRNVSVFSPSLHNVSLVISMDSSNKQKSSFTSWCNSCDWLHRDNCTFYVQQSSRAEQWKQGKKDWPWNVLS